MNEVLYVPAAHLRAVIRVIREGLKRVRVTPEVREQLTIWCDDEEAYLNQE